MTTQNSTGNNSNSSTGSGGRQQWQQCCEQSSSSDYTKARNGIGSWKREAPYPEFNTSPAQHLHKVIEIHESFRLGDPLGNQPEKNRFSLKKGSMPSKPRKVQSKPTLCNTPAEFAFAIWTFKPSRQRLMLVFCRKTPRTGTVGNEVRMFAGSQLLSKSFEGKPTMLALMPDEERKLSKPQQAREIRLRSPCLVQRLWFALAATCEAASH